MSGDLASLAASLGIIDELYDRFREDESQVDDGFRQLFSGGEMPLRNGHGQVAAAGTSVWPLVQAYRSHGHAAAKIDPLDMLDRADVPELDPAWHGLVDADIRFEDGPAWTRGLTLAEVCEELSVMYSASVGLEFTHINNARKKKWLAERMEGNPRAIPDEATRLAMLKQVIAAETFESFCHTKFPGTKRFSLEGGESIMPLLEGVLDHAARLGAIEAVLGMAHRGRLNVLTGIMGRQPREIFSEFEDIDPESTLGAGDVKYHAGYSHDRVDRFGNTMHLSLAYNPSHLEAVDPVVVGRVRAKQYRHEDLEHSRVLGILLHGDAAFSGQGLVAETLQLSNLHGYRTGGTVHIVVNNQIGFTASPREYRSTPYCTGIAKMIQCPIWHVNGEDLDAVARVVEMAMDYRAVFRSDVVIDILCYRKFGHNEMDEPSFTNPLMYTQVRKKKPVDVMYGQRLIADKQIDEAGIKTIRDGIRLRLEEELSAGKSAEKRPQVSAMAGMWSQYQGGDDAAVPDPDTGVPLERLRAIAEAATLVPDGFSVHRNVQKILDRRAEMGRGEKSLDWGMGEILAYGSLAWDGVSVRLSGQDSARGTFSHRHAILADVQNGDEHLVLGSLHPDQGRVRIYDSPLSEAGVLGFEFGFSLDCPDGLVCWEAQFGDFANGAQVIIDQFIMSSEDKWKRLSGVVLLLPHGYEGQGPEHSSARMERYLQSCAEDNVQVAQPSTPAQMFHLLRRQVVRKLRKPLVVMSPKSLLRLPEASSELSELTTGRFQRVIGDETATPDKVTRVLLCSGRIYYDLVKERESRGATDTAIIRLEQLYPWRPEAITEVLASYKSAVDFCWVQDEPENMGPWGFLQPRLIALFGFENLRVACRAASASPATGSGKAHAIEQKALLNAAFSTP